MVPLLSLLLACALEGKEVILLDFQSLDSSVIIDVERNEVIGSPGPSKPGDMNTVLVSRVAVKMLDDIPVRAVGADLDGSERHLRHHCPRLPLTLPLA